MKKIIGIIVLIIIVILLVALGGGSKGETGPIKIGVVAPLSGDAAQYGEPVRNGVMIAVDNINGAGGINGRKVDEYVKTRIIILFI